MFEEIKKIFRDQGTVLFCIALPLLYPVLYSWIYNNEVVREVPVVVVDDSHSALSREFIRKLNASPDVSVSLYCNTIAEGRDAIGHRQAYGMVYFPHDFATNNGRMEQSHVSVYCDMSYMLTYKAIFQACTNVAQSTGKIVKSEPPLEISEVPIFNTTGGYGNFIIPAVLVLIIQQALLLAVGLLTGTERERGFDNIPALPHGTPFITRLCTAIQCMLSKSCAFIAVFFVMLAYDCMIVPRLFGFVSMLHFGDWMLLMVPYMLACVFMSIALSCMVRYRESVILLVVFSSIPLLFLSGVSWPESNLPAFWSGVANLAPSTFGIRGFVKMNSMGARVTDIAHEVNALWLQAFVYGCIGLYVTYRRVKYRISP